LRCLACAPNSFLPEPAILVADDQVEVTRIGSTLRASAPQTIRGLIEVRGLGIVTVACVASAEVVLAADIVSPADVERLPEAAEATRIQGIDVPVIRLAPFEASAPIKLFLALATRAGPGSSP
jgi:serine kinase of HPr protein (carbohydrate metabolism regulator)